MFSQTRAFPDPVLPVADLGGSLNKMSYGVFLRLMTVPFHRTISRWRKESLGLPSQRLLASELYLCGRPVHKLVCCSPHIVVPPVDWYDSTTVTGYWMVRKTGNRPLTSPIFSRAVHRLYSWALAPLGVDFG